MDMHWIVKEAEAALVLICKSSTDKGQLEQAKAKFDTILEYWKRFTEFQKEVEGEKHAIIQR